MTEIDKLTGFTTQKFFTQRLEDEVLRVRRYKEQLSVLMAEPAYDFFDKDPYLKNSLHYAILKQLGGVFRRVLRDVDLMCRYEGDAVAAMLPETDEKGALLAGERLRKEVEAHEFIGDETKNKFHIALNIGVAVYLKHAKTAHELIVSAQKGLQVAIADGGNRTALCPVTLEEASPSS